MHTIRKYIEDREGEMLSLLENVVRINSHTADKDGVDRVGGVFAGALEDMGFSVRAVRQTACGDHLVAENPAAAQQGGVLLCGHMDTVFPEEMGFSGFFRRDGKIMGPGVCDMKGGLVVGVYALKALQAAGDLDDRPAVFILNSDEETGSLTSRDLITAEAGKRDFSFVLEAAEPGGEVIVGRKGRKVFRLRALGRACHAGYADRDKASAILELARKISALERLNDPAAGVSVNVGRVSGGIGPNTVPGRAEAEAEYRFIDQKTGDAVWGKIVELAGVSETPGVALDLAVTAGRPPMPTTDGVERLYGIVSEIGADLGLAVGRAYRGGGSDANTVSRAGVPVLDGMGPIGGALHTRDEYIFEKSLTERAVLCALSMRRSFALS